MCHLKTWHAVAWSQSSCYFAVCIACSPLRVTVHYQAHDQSSQDAELTLRLTASLCLLHRLMPERLARDVFLPVGSGVNEQHSSVVHRGTGALFVFHPGEGKYFGITLACVSLPVTPLRGRSECKRVARPRACYLTYHHPFPLISSRRRQLFCCTARINVHTDNIREGTDEPMIAILAKSRYTFLGWNVSICMNLSSDTCCLHL